MSTPDPNDPIPKSSTRTLGLAEALNHAASLIREGKLDAAERLCLDILKTKPDDFDAVFLLGMVKARRRDHDGALACFDRALQSNPGSYEALYNRGATLEALRRHEEAIATYDDALIVNPGCADSLNNRGNALQALHRHVEAIDSYDRALRLKPDFSEALNNRGNALLALRRHDEALHSYDLALDFEPTRAEFLNHRGVALEALQRYSEALESYDKALSLKPAYAEALCNRGVTLQALNRNVDAMESYDKALSLAPDYANALWNKSLLLLLLGDFTAGWPLYEWRWKRSDAPAVAERPEPLWQEGEAIRGKRVLLYAEQGLGDTIQFSRYTKLVAREGATVVLEVPRTLAELLRGIEGASHVIATGEASLPCDLRCPLMRLPLLFKTSLATVPGEVPYLRADQERLAKWSAKLGPRRRLRVGLAWSGGALLRNDRNRSIPLALLAALLRLPIDWICLQKDIRDADRLEMDKHPTLREFVEELDDFTDTAALIELCDLVISVDTAVAHLAGALDKPVWLLIPFAPDWRWLLDREDSPWYPTVRLFRQSAVGDWAQPIERIVSELKWLAPAS
jgi:tetratricopeptide (TPR) repeat protein